MLITRLSCLKLTLSLYKFRTKYVIFFFCEYLKLCGEGGFTYKTGEKKAKHILKRIKFFKTAQYKWLKLFGSQSFCSTSVHYHS